MTETSFIREIRVLREIRDSDKQGMICLSERMLRKGVAPLGLQRGAERVFYKPVAPLGLRYFIQTVF